MNSLPSRIAHQTFAWMLALMATVAMPSFADDTEVYINPSTTGVVPNLMFVLDLSDSMNDTTLGTTPAAGETSRLEILKEAIEEVLDSDLPAVNVGLSTFTRNEGSGIKWPTLGKDDDANTYDPAIPAGTTVSDVIKGIVDAAVAPGNGYTPTVDQLYEVARYFRGESLLAPRNHVFGTWNVGANAYTGGWDNPAGWRAANPISFTGGLNLVHPDLGIHRYTTNYCNDYSMRTPAGTNHCADEFAAGMPMKCVPKPGRTCSTTQCDSGCGYNTVCQDSGGSTVPWGWTQPSNCLNKPDGSVWVTGWSGGVPNRCCKAGDSGGSECTSNQSYTRFCPSPGTQTSACRTDRGFQPYEQCYTGQEDTRAYISPITQQCQKSAIVLLTDGDPSINNVDWGRRNGADTWVSWPYYIRDMIRDDLGGSWADSRCVDKSSDFGAAPWGQRYANCGVELAEHLNTQDQVSTVAGSTIQTHTIGFGLAGPVADATWGWLQEVANAGGGEAYQADDVDTLTDSFENVIKSLTSGNQSFRNFSATFDVSTLSTGNRAYISLFSPNEYRAWQGNLKGYFLKADGLYDVNDNAATEVDLDGKVVFRPTARSFWSNGVDGNSAENGGFKSTFVPASRDLYVLTDPAVSGTVNLSNGNYDLEDANTNLTTALMGMPGGATATDRTDLIEFARSKRMGDPLHSRPTIVNYGDGVGDPGDVLFIGTNQGFLHAVDINRPSSTGDVGGGDELFAFMPYESIGTLHEQDQNSTSGSHIYGVDGPINVWRNDKDDNREIDGTDQVILYFGLRRGGSAYYALDITDPEAPKVLWKIDPTTTGFSKLGQSWSQMTLADIKKGTETKKVLIFGGGYDLDQDVINQVRPAAGDDKGLGVYIVDAVDGSLIKSIGPDATFDINSGLADMKYAIPADIKVVDSDFDGIDDRLYFGDLGGQLWRVDISESGGYNTTGKFQAYKFADFGKDGSSLPTAATNRRFFYEPSVARYARAGSLVFAISIGSGYRAHPLDATIEDKVFMVYDDNAMTGAPVTAPSALTTTNLYDATDDDITNGTQAEQDAAKAALAAAGNKGWFISLDPKEKVLARTRLFRSKVLMTTFSPIGSTTNVCDVTNTTNKLFLLSVDDASGEFPVDTDNDGVLDDEVRSQVVADQAVILDEPLVVSYKDESGGGPRCTDPDNCKSPPPRCEAIYGGAQRMVSFCSAPNKVNWSTLQ